MKEFLREMWPVLILAVLFSAGVGLAVNAIIKQEQRNTAYQSISITFTVKP